MNRHVDPGNRVSDYARNTTATLSAHTGNAQPWRFFCARLKRPKHDLSHDHAAGNLFQLKEHPLWV